MAILLFKCKTMKFKCIFVILTTFFFVPNEAFSQAKVAQGNFLGTSSPLKELVSKDFKDTRDSKQKMKKRWKEVPNPSLEEGLMVPPNKNSKPQSGDPLTLTRMDDLYGLIDIEFVSEGNSQADSGVFPGDPEGDNGLEYYIHATNGSGTLLRIFDKQGNLIEGPFSLNTLWTSLGVAGLGDPIIMFDHDAERWVLTEFQAGGVNALLMAVSETSDPMGSYHTYQFLTPSFPDYPKYGVWPDAYYVTTNEFADSFIPVYIIDRNKVLNGEATNIVRLGGMTKFFIGGQVVSQRATPAEWDGEMPPPEGAPHLSLRIFDDSWGIGEDKIEIWEAHYDPENPNQSELIGPIEIFPSAFDAHLCNESTRDCVCQPDTEQLVPVIPHVIQNRVQYRNFGTHEMMLLNFPVDINGENVAGVRWMELRKYPDQDWELYQEGTYATDDGVSRFMASVAMDKNGNIALTYTAVGKDSVYLGLRTTGRLDGDPLGEMTFAETSIVEGGGISPTNRWGDYSSLSLDPINDEDFYFTGQYIRSNEQWGTKVAKFQLKKFNHDLSARTIVYPTTSPELTNSETVRVNFKNLGLSEESDAMVGLIVNGELIVEEDLGATLSISETVEHIFSVPVDFEALGEYEIVSYIKSITDENFTNDTVQSIIVKQAKYDLASISFDNLNPTLCGDSLRLFVRVKNLGQYPIEQFTTAAIVGTDSLAITVDSVLNFNAEYVQAFTFSDITEGENIIKARAIIPNGIEDELPLDNLITDTINYDPEAISLNIFLASDFYSSETSWSLKDADGNIILEKSYTSNEVRIENLNFCLDSACYVFELFDDYGDGFSWGGEPALIISDETGKILGQLENKNFGSYKAFEFCLPFECALTIDADKLDASAEETADGEILILTENGIPPFEYSIDGGNAFQSEPLFQNLSAGDYDILVKDANGCEQTLSVNVGFASDVQDELQKNGVNIYPNPNDGHFNVSISSKGYSGTNIKVQILGSSGKLIYESLLPKYNDHFEGRLGMVDLPNGIYYLRINHKNSKQLYKIIKQ